MCICNRCQCTVHMLLKEKSGKSKARTILVIHICTRFTSIVDTLCLFQRILHQLNYFGLVTIMFKFLLTHQVQLTFYLDNNCKIHFTTWLWSTQTCSSVLYNANSIITIHYNTVTSWLPNILSSSIICKYQQITMNLPWYTKCMLWKSCSLSIFLAKFDQIIFPGVVSMEHSTYNAKLIWDHV